MGYLHVVDNANFSCTCNMCKEDKWLYDITIFLHLHVFMINALELHTLAVFMSFCSMVPYLSLSKTQNIYWVSC